MASGRFMITSATWAEGRPISTVMGEEQVGLCALWTEQQLSDLPTYVLNVRHIRSTTMPSSAAVWTMREPHRVSDPSGCARRRPH